MVMTALRDGASGGILKYFLLGLLVMATGGLVFMDIGGFFRGGITSSDAAKIGSNVIPIQQFDRTVRTTLSRLGMSPAQAYQLGYIKELLNGEIRASLIQQKAADTGIQVSTQQVAANIKKLIAPMTQPGQSPQDVLAQILRAQGMSEDQLTASIRREMSVNMLGNAVQSGFLKTSETMTRDLAAYENEQRNVDYILFKDADLKEIEQPADEQLLKLYESTKEAYAIPEMRKSKLITIKMDTLKDSLEISDEEIKDVYERNISSYTQPETREIEQVILSDADQAEDIAKKIEAGASLKDATKEVTGNTTDYIPATSVEKTALLEELQEPVFTAKEGDLLGPIESGLGYHVAMLITITPAHTTSLETAKKDIRTELTETRLLDAQYDLAASLDDYLAASEPIETIKENLSVEIKDLPATNRFGIGENDKSAFNEEFGPDAQNMVSILFELGEGEASPVTELTDGRMSALLVENITEKSYKPFEDQKKALKKRWIDDSRRVQNKMHTLKLLTTAQGDGTSIKDLAKAKGRTLSSAKDLKRASEIEQPLTKAALGQIFEAKQNELFALDLDEGAAIMVVTNTTIPEKLKDEELKAAQNTHLQEMQNEAYTLYINSLRKKYGVRVNEKLLQMVYAPQDN
ncbi:MAG: peptidyl-prolyl cis-trans isomerase [Rhodospirillales bacterium]|nr:MAG: peptidyl-prolyl cis-trans isomerase [Rhodospirillales bacterium]